MRYSVTAAALVAALGAANPAGAAVMFNLTGNGGLADSYTFTKSGITLKVTPGTTDEALTTVTTPEGPDFRYQVGQYSGGLGVTTHAHDSHQVDGANRNDILIFDFTAPAAQTQLLSVRFTFNDGNDDFTFWFDDDKDGKLDGDYIGKVDIPNNGKYTFAETYAGFLFGIGAVDDYDNFKVKKIKVDVVAAPHPAPIPMALPLLGSALVGLGVVGWRKSKSS